MELNGLEHDEQHLHTDTTTSHPLPHGFDQRSQDDLFSKYVQEDSARMGRLWKQTMHQQFQKGNGYRSVAALLVRWNDEHDRDLKCAQEVDELQDLLRHGYHYDSKVLQLDDHTHPQQQLNHGIAELVRNHDGDHRTHLLIVYYSGHGIEGKSGELQLAAAPNNDNPMLDAYDARLNWVAAERDLDNAEADVLIVLDCCAAGVVLQKDSPSSDGVQPDVQSAPVPQSLENSLEHSNVHLIATQFVETLNERLQSANTTMSFSIKSKAHEVLLACGGRQKAEKPGNQSFTRHLIDLLRDELSNVNDLPMCTFELNSKITRRRPNVKSSSQVHQRYAHIRHERFIRLAPLKSTRVNRDESGFATQRNVSSACIDFTVSLSTKTSLTDAEVQQLASELSEAAKRAQPNVTKIEWNGFQLAPNIIRFQRALWSLTMMVHYARRWKRIVRKKQSGQADDVFDGADTNTCKRQTIEISSSD